MGGAPSVQEWDGCARRSYELVGVAMWAGMCINGRVRLPGGCSVLHCHASHPYLLLVCVYC